MKTYAFTNENGEEERIEAERWQWGVVYNDGTELWQFDDRDDTYHRIGEIDQENAKMFSVFKGDMSKRIDMPMIDGMRIIYKYKNFHDQSFANFNDTVRVFMFGYKLSAEGQAAQYHFNFILPDDRLITSPVENVGLDKFNIKR